MVTLFLFISFILSLTLFTTGLIHSWFIVQLYIYRESKLFVKNFNPPFVRDIKFTLTKMFDHFDLVVFVTWRAKGALLILGEQN